MYCLIIDYKDQILMADCKDLLTTLSLTLSHFNSQLLAFISLKFGNQNDKNNITETVRN